MPDPGDISADEFLYRKIPVKPNWYNPERQELAPDAFRPREEDNTGISFDRAKSNSNPEFRSVEEVAVGPSSEGYFVAVLRVSDLIASGLTVKADPIAGNPGHALLTDLTSANRREVISRERMTLLAHELTLRVEGPFK